VAQHNLNPKPERGSPV